MSLAKKTTDQKITISKNLILVRHEARDRNSILSQLAKLLIDYGYVKESFIQGILDRENMFPTGLSTAVTGVAIPHTDSTHVITPAIAIATLNEPVVFNSMEDPSKEVLISIVIMLAINDPKAQLSTLQKIMVILQSQEILLRIQESKSSAELVEVINNHLKS